MKKALLVGINEYPDKKNILAACLNDVNDFAEFLTSKCGFDCDNIRILTERRATKAEILKRLDWLVRGVKSGDRLVFLYSGHGNRLATRNAEGRVDKYYECICPYDFDWDGKNNISDSDLCELFARVPKGAKLVWISDSCYSGGLTGLEESGARVLVGPRNRTMQMPVDIAWRIKAALFKNLEPLTMPGAVQDSHVVLISATRERQQAQERCFRREIKINGVLVSFLLEELSREGGLSMPLSEVMENVIRNVKRYAKASKPHFEQEPAIHGRPELLARPFLK
jgi:metacaspase-1